MARKKLTEEEQVTDVEILTEQMDKASNEKKEMIILGDANVCAQNWKGDSCKHKKVAEEIAKEIKADLCEIESGRYKGIFGYIKAKIIHTNAWESAWQTALIGGLAASVAMAEAWPGRGPGAAARSEAPGS